MKLAKKTVDAVERRIRRIDRRNAATFLAKTALVLGVHGFAGTRLELQRLTFAGV